jgi:hypothetical protein
MRASPAMVNETGDNYALCIFQFQACRRGFDEMWQICAGEESFHLNKQIFFGNSTRLSRSK